MGKRRVAEEQRQGRSMDPVPSIVCVGMHAFCGPAVNKGVIDAVDRSIERTASEEGTVAGNAWGLGSHSRPSIHPSTEAFDTWDRRPRSIRAPRSAPSIDSALDEVRAREENTRVCGLGRPHTTARSAVQWVSVLAIG